MSGSGAIIVLDDSTDIVEGWRTSQILCAREVADNARPAGRITLDVQALHPTYAWPGRRRTRLSCQNADNIPGGRTICAFGEACAWPVQSFVGKFKG